MSAGAWLLQWIMKLAWFIVRNRKPDMKRLRKNINFWAGFIPRPFRVKYQRFSIEGIAAEWMVPRGADETKILYYLHGGAYAMCSIVTHRRLISLIAKRAGVKALAIEYCLVPEDVFPQALNQACKAYQWLLSQGYRPENIVIGGDSAGGGLATATLLKLRDDKVPLPSGAILLSPWTDLEGMGESNTMADQASLINNVALREYGVAYAGNEDLRHPYISPVYGDFHGLPPIYIQVSDIELLYDDSTRLKAKALRDGVSVRMDVWKRMQHVWQVYDFFVPEAKRALKDLAAFVSERLQTKHIPIP
ncbi:MAG: alpha/beta hydrolase [Chitinophagales bacterium]|nr:alpha/beta hydrolase [Chitinophagales bacterium]